MDHNKKSKEKSLPEESLPQQFDSFVHPVAPGPRPTDQDQRTKTNGRLSGRQSNIWSKSCHQKRKEKRKERRSRRAEFPKARSICLGKNLKQVVQTQTPVFLTQMKALLALLLLVHHFH